MSVIGITRESKRFLESLDECKLIDLFADLLTLEGHKKIRITDGPGDGGRDIHSLDENEEKCLTQSKFHSDISKSISARTLGELVSSMVRLGYKRGIFLTNAKISPPAKRDCLDSYPGYSIDFVDGRELINRVFDNLVLKAIWFDGKSIDTVNFALIIPVIGRNLETDEPISLREKNGSNTRLKVGSNEGQFRYHRSITLSRLSFPAYRPPEVKTIESIMSGNIPSIEIVISGAIHLGDYDLILKKVIERTIRVIREKNKELNHFALSFGVPFVAPLAGLHSGGRFQLEDVQPITIVSHNNQVEYEKDWLLPIKKKEWILPTFFQVSQMEYARWLNQKRDICFNLSVICSATERNKWVVDQRNEFHLEGWKKSLFVLVSNKTLNVIQSNNECKSPQIYSWNSESSLLTWPNPIYFEDSLVEIDEKNPQISYNPQIQKKYAKIQAIVEKLGGTVIDPIKARHMMAVIDSDPFPASQNMEFRSVELAYETQNVPTPILPNTRQIRFTVCWLITNFDGNILSLEQMIPRITEKFNKLDEGENYEFDLKYYPPNEYQSSCYFTCNFYLITPIGFENTSDLLAKLEPEIFTLIDRFELVIKEFFTVSRATEVFWKNVLCVSFDPNDKYGE